MRLALVACSCLLWEAGAAAPPNPPNMNGDYLLARTPKGKDPSLFPTNYADYPGGAEYFDVYSPPITTTYAQVFWKRMDTVLPPAIVKRFRNKTMAVIGLEWDQVRRTPTGDVSVPMNIAYNHHYFTDLLGADAEMVRVPKGDPRVPHNPHGHPHTKDGKVPVVVDKNPDSAYPNHQAFYSQNGGEARKSFKGFAPGYARMIQSPEKFHMQVMQIDTFNRDAMNLTGSAFVAGPMPKNSLSPPGAAYSGLLECPLTTRVTKVFKADYVVKVSGACAIDITTEAECRAAATALAPKGSTVNSSTVNSRSLPKGCSAALQPRQDGGKGTTLAVRFNEGAPTQPLCGVGKTTMTGTEASLVTLSVTMTGDKVTITMRGPSEKWFGVGFGAEKMGDRPWTLVVDGHGVVSEHRLANHLPGTPLPPSVTVISNAVSDGNRTVVVTRSRKGDVFSFDPLETKVPFINAVGMTPVFAYHGQLCTAASLMMLASKGVANCVCAVDPPPFGKGTGFLRYEDTEQVQFRNMCHDEVLQTKNPTCDLRTYVGGIQTCLDGWHLLDADQEIPWKDQPITYHHKYRFWFQPHVEQKEPTHYSWLMGADVGEYDVPACPSGEASCTHELTGTHLIPEEHTYMVAVQSHCHSATCVSIQLYYNDTGELLCDQRSVFGQGADRKPSGPDRFDEEMYINRPPCLFGPAEFGLQPPPKVGGRVLRAVAITNNTNGHHGEMAIPVFFTVSEP